MAKAREYTMPQTERESRPGAWEGTGYKQFDQSSNLQDQLKLLESDRVRVQKELDELKIKRQNFDLLSVNVPEQTDEDKENIQAGQFRAGAEAMMEYDPATAQSWLLRADEIEARKQNRTREQTPEAARHQLRIARDKAMDIVSSDSDQVSSADRELAKKIALIYTTEMSKPNPSTQFAEIKIDELYKSQLTPNGGGGGGTYNDLSTEISTTIGGIKFKGKALDDANLALLKKINDSKLSQTDIDRLKSELNLAVSTKGGAPKVTDVDKEVDKLFAGSSTQPIPSDYGRYSKSYNAYNAARAAYGSDAIGAAIANFLYSLRPEAVNEGDIELAKNSVRSGDQQALKTVLDKAGMGGIIYTDYRDLARKLGDAAYNKLIDDRKANTDQIVALMNKLNPDQVRKRALTYYKLPNKLVAGAGKPNPNAPVVVPVPPPSNNIPTGMKEGGTWSDKYYNYRLKNGKPQSKKKG